MGDLVELAQKIERDHELHMKFFELLKQILNGEIKRD